MARQNRSGDLSLRASSLFYLILVVPFWFWGMVAIFGDNSIDPPVFDPETGELLSSQKEFSEYIFHGERKYSDFPMGGRIAMAVFLTLFLLYWGVRIHLEWLAIRQAGKLVRRVVNRH